MSKNEFLNELRNYLSGSLNGAEVEDSIRYYENYINEHVARGERESKVIDELGDPRIIGRSIVDAAGRRKTSFRSEPYEETKVPDSRKERSANDTRRKLKFYGTIAIVLLVMLVVLIAVTKVIAFFFPLIVVIVILSWLFRQTGGRR